VGQAAKQDKGQRVKGKRLTARAHSLSNMPAEIASSTARDAASAGQLPRKERTSAAADAQLPAVAAVVAAAGLGGPEWAARLPAAAPDAPAPVGLWDVSAAALPPVPGPAVAVPAEPDEVSAGPGAAPAAPPDAADTTSASAVAAGAATTAGTAASLAVLPLPPPPPPLVLRHWCLCSSQCSAAHCWQQ